MIYGLFFLDYRWIKINLTSKIYLWQEPFIAQFAQLQPQEDLPFFLSLTKPTIIKVTISASTRHIIMVARFCEIHEIIISVPFTLIYFLIFTF